jgi:hypothetical protein
VRITWGSDLNSSTVGFLVGNEDATPRGVIGMAHGFLMLPVGITSEYVSCVGFS